MTTLAPPPRAAAPRLTDAEIVDAAARLEGAAPADVLRWAADRFAPRLGFATGFGVEGCVIIEIIGRLQLPIEIFTLDTGLLFPETYALWRTLEQRYGVTIRGVTPAQTVEQQAAAHGPALWERDSDACCALRKVTPLAAEAARLDAWVSAIRRDQTRARADARVVERDGRFDLVKINPLVGWSNADVWRHVLAAEIPYNPLHDQGYPSIGCAPCTGPVAAGEDPRAGRWRGQAKTECGLHAAPTAADAPISIRVPSSSSQENRHDPRRTPWRRPRRSHRLGRARRLAHRRGRSAAARHARRARARRPRADRDRRGEPLTGFLGQADHARVLAEMRLVSGVVWPVPLVLAVDDVTRLAVQQAKAAALHDGDGRLWGIVRVGPDDVWQRDPIAEVRAVYGTDDVNHPGVAYVL